MYFAPTVPSVNLKADASGKFTVTVETREDALYVPIDAVAEVDGKKCVYVPDESGLKTAREVTVGLTTARSCEIMSGAERRRQGHRRLSAACFQAGFGQMNGSILRGHMKKYIVLCLAILLAAALSGCAAKVAQAPELLTPVGAQMDTAQVVPRHDDGL